MNIKLKNLLFLVIFLNSYEIICMENFSQEAADRQLLDIINNITIAQQPWPPYGCVHPSGTQLIPGIAIAGLYHKSIGFNAQPIEQAVLAHEKGRLFNSPNIFKKEKNIIEKNQIDAEKIWQPVSWNGPVEKSEPPKELLNLIKSTPSSVIEQLKSVDDNRKYILNYLLFNPKSSLQKQEKKSLIKEYISVNKIPIYETNLAIDKNFEDYLKTEFPSEPGKWNQSIDHKCKSRIDGYLNSGGKIILPLLYCILHNDTLFSQENTPMSEPSQDSIDIAKWLLYEKHGWLYIDDLFIKIITSPINKKKQVPQTMRCLALIKSYDMLKTIQTKIYPSFCNIKKEYDMLKTVQGYSFPNIKEEKERINKRLDLIDLLQFLLGNKLIVDQESLNDAFLSALHLKSDQDNTLFYKKNAKKIHQEARLILKLLSEAGANNTTEALLILVKKFANSQYTHYVETANLLLDWGADPNVLFYRDETGKKTCYLAKHSSAQATKLFTQVLLHPKRLREDDELEDFEYLKAQKLNYIMSIFNNIWKEKGQQDLYNYAINVYKFAFEARKTGNTQPLREHIINRYKSTFWGKLYYLQKTILGKISNLRNIFTKKTTFWGYQIRNNN